MKLPSPIAEASMEVFAGGALTTVKENCALPLRHLGVEA